MQKNFEEGRFFFFFFSLYNFGWPEGARSRSNCGARRCVGRKLHNVDKQQTKFRSSPQAFFFFFSPLSLSFSFRSFSFPPSSCSSTTYSFTWNIYFQSSRWVRSATASFIHSFAVTSVTRHDRVFYYFLLSNMRGKERKKEREGKCNGKKKKKEKNVRFEKK